MQQTDYETEIICTLTDAEFRERRSLARQNLLTSVTSSRRHNNGFDIQFTNTPAMLELVKEFIRLEQGCCGFLDFDLEPTPTNPGDPINLTVTGPQGSARFIDIFNDLIKDATHAKITT